MASKLNITQILSEDVLIYVILDMGLIERYGKNAAEIMTRSFSAGAKIFQLRHKGIFEKKLFEEASALARIAKDIGALLIVNDSLSVALASGANGVHLGEEDLPITAARAISSKDFIIGASARSIERARRAQEEGANYIGYGAMFPTQTKENIVMGSIAELKKMMTSVKIPIFCLGGINENNIFSIVDAGCKRICVASAVIMAEDIEKTTRNLLNAMKGTPN